MKARDNPFATERVLQLRYQFQIETERWPAVLMRLKSLNYRAAIVGPHGSGKTTLLENLGEHLRADNFRLHRLFLNEQNRNYPIEFIRQAGKQLTRRDIILLDGCEQLEFFNWWRFLWQTRRAGGLIITTHRAGRLPTLFRCRTNANLLADLVNQLLGAEYSVKPIDYERLFRKHRGNLREALRDLYDIAASVCRTDNPVRLP